MGGLLGHCTALEAKSTWSVLDSGPASRGHSGAVPLQITACAHPNENCAPPSEDCAPKKETSSVLLGCRSRSEGLKILIITQEFVSKNRFVVDSAVKTFFFVLHPRNRALEPIFRKFSSKALFFVFCLYPRNCAQEPIFRRFYGENLFFLVFTLEFEGTKFLCTPKLFLLPQSRYSGPKPVPVPLGFV